MYTNKYYGCTAAPGVCGNASCTCSRCNEEKNSSIEINNDIESYFTVSYYKKVATYKDYNFTSILTKTDKAVLFYDSTIDSSFWVPKSICLYNESLKMLKIFDYFKVNYITPSYKPKLDKVTNLIGSSKYFSIKSDLQVKNQSLQNIIQSKEYENFESTITNYLNTLNSWQISALKLLLKKY